MAEDWACTHLHWLVMQHADQISNRTLGAGMAAFHFCEGARSAGGPTLHPKPAYYGKASPALRTWLLVSS
jgi:hypothetical protein